jgi:hypothetical protein
MGGSDVQSSLATFLRRKVPKRLTRPLELLVGRRFIFLRYLPPGSSIARPKHPYIFLTRPSAARYQSFFGTSSTDKQKTVITIEPFGLILRTVVSLLGTWYSTWYRTCLSIFFSTCKPTVRASRFSSIRTCIEYCGGPRLSVHSSLDQSREIIPSPETHFIALVLLQP